MPGLNHREIARLFNSTFEVEYGVVMSGGYSEPLYLPGEQLGEGKSHVRYTYDHASSALHEASHWCMAGRARRKLVDYGYFYDPPPRSEVTQRRFEYFELDAQALEYLLSRSADIPFHVSLDDVGTTLEAAYLFRCRVERRARDWLMSGLPPRAALFMNRLACNKSVRFAEMSIG